MSAATELQHPRVRWLLEFLRMSMIVLGAGFIGIVANMFAARPVPLLASDGPGSFAAEAPRIAIGELREALAQQSPPLLIDARGPESFAQGHPAGAIHLSPKDFHQKYTQFSSILKAAPQIVVLCESEDCPLSDELAKLLIDLNFHNVRVLSGGWRAYKTSGLSIEKGKK